MRKSLITNLITCEKESDNKSNTCEKEFGTLWECRRIVGERPDCQWQWVAAAAVPKQIQSPQNPVQLQRGHETLSSYRESSKPCPVKMGLLGKSSQARVYVMITLWCGPIFDVIFMICMCFYVMYTLCSYCDVTQFWEFPDPQPPLSAMVNNSTFGILQFSRNTLVVPWVH